MEWVKIATFALVAGIAYGILHDQVTAHLCVEYFTIAHPPLFPRAMAPFWLAICWASSRPGGWHCHWGFSWQPPRGLAAGRN